MCGIAGILSLKGGIPLNRHLQNMIDVVKHRGPDDIHTIILGNVALGHVRLSIIDLSESGRQPMSNEDGTIWLVYNGEIYNYIELTDELKKRGHIFRSQSDSEVILHAYEEWGEQCVEKFNGMWAFTIYDTAMQRIFSSRDRYGIKPYYYFFNGNVFAFSSEIKQLLTLSDFVSKKINYESVYDYIVLSLENHSERTFFRDVYQLMGGHNLTLDLKTGHLNIYRWYDLPELGRCLSVTKKFKKDRDIIDYVRYLLFDSVRLRLRSDVPVGSCLSGGLDSSSIVIFANKLLKSTGKNFRQEMFSWCFHPEEIEPDEFNAINECEYAKKVAHYVRGISNKVYPDFKSLVNEIESLIWHQDEPFRGLSVYGQWSVMKKAKERGVKVLLDGQGGDEVFLGYERYFVFLLKSYLNNGNINEFIREFLYIPRNSKLNTIELMKYYAYFSLPAIRKLFTRKRRERIFRDEFLIEYKKVSGKENSGVRFSNIYDFHANEIKRYQLPHLLRYEDRDSMAFSIEARLPFLDYRLVEFVFCLPMDFKIRYGWTKYALRHAVKNCVPHDVVWRKVKIGSDVPENTWINMLKPRMYEILLGEDTKIKHIIKKSEIKQVDNRILWKLYNLELWLRKFS